MRGERIELERWSPAGWGPVATIEIQQPELGLLSPMRLEHNTLNYAFYPLEPGVFPEPRDFEGDQVVPILSLPFVQWPSPRIAGEIFDTYEGEPVAALLRDLVPSGWARRRLLEKVHTRVRLGDRHHDGPHQDLVLLKEATRSPIGNLRINWGIPADESFLAVPLEMEDPAYWGWPYLSCIECYNDDPRDPLCAGLGAGGENPKLLINRASDGQYYLDGNEPRSCPVTDYWLVKWPREPVSRNRIDILQAEYLYLRALRSLGFDVPEVQWRLNGLWIRRFDRGPKGERYPVESLYNVMGLIGNGARLSHMDALDAILPLASDPDEMLIEYLVRDHINRLLGNSDNHGRNTAFHRTFHGLQLTPMYDVAPMVMDEDGIAWSTTWPKAWQTGGHADWQRVIQQFAQSPDQVWAGLQSRSAALTELQRTDSWQALPESVTRHPRVMPIGVPVGL